ncbi:hypothetical protein KKH3_12200 [Pectobacterium actinidiae]|nr:hypothetical protein KKH3_12200 [Pectobacterium actinidiae]
MFVNYFLLINFLKYRNMSLEDRIIKDQCFPRQLFSSSMCRGKH